MGADRERPLEQALAALRAGQVIAIPTDTVYGLAASLEHPQAIEQLFAIKGRDTTKAIPVLVDDVSRLDIFARDVPPAALKLANTFWPGALTMVLHASDRIPFAIHQGSATVGLRMPDNALALEIIARSGGGLAVTSANLSGEPEAQTAEGVRAALGERVAVIVDGGPAMGGRPSTVVDLTAQNMRILRQGAIAAEDLQRTIAD